MNAIAFALESAVKEARDSRQLREAFERRFTEAQFREDSENIIVPVPQGKALAWARGEIGDLDLILSMNGQDQSAIWWPLLPRLSGYAQGVREAKRLHNAGARCLVTYTTNPVVRRKCLRHGGRVTFTDAFGGERILADAAALNHWLGRIP